MDHLLQHYNSLHFLKYLPRSFKSKSIPLITPVNKELTEIISFPLIKVMIHGHSNRDIAIIYYESLTSIIPISISPCQYPGTVRHIVALIFTDR